jgi:hypothetical protein
VLEGELVRLRRRAAELEALYSTARELVRLQDVDEVLSRLVERAHALMGTDVTYLSEMVPESGDLRVRHSVGTVTPEFRDLHVPAGAGLASKVVTTRAPAWVPRYGEMRETPRDPRIDAAVEAEGLVSFLGVPLAVGDEVLGALFACNRFAHEYSPDEVLLLSAFADHAAAVLHSARVIADRAAATARAEEAYHQLELHLSATEVASAIHEELTAAVMSGGTVVDLVATVSRRLDRGVWALDEDGRPLHSAVGVGLPRRALLTDAAARSHLSGHAEQLDVDGRRWLVVAIPGADRVIGSILAADDGALADDVTRRTLERAAQVAALVSLKQDAVGAIRAERRATLLLDQLDGRGRDDSARDPHLALSGALVACAVLDVKGRSLLNAAAAAVDAVGADGLVAQRDDRLIVAWATPDALDRTERLRRVLADRLREPGVTAVVGGVDAARADLAASVERASRDLRFLPSLGITGATVSSDAFAPYHLLASSTPGAVEDFVGELIGPVLGWDEQRGTELFATLCAYFDAGESRQDAATRLRIHKNTVQQRLARIDELLPGAWDDPEFRFRVHAAVRLERLRRSLA